MRSIFTGCVLAATWLLATGTAFGQRSQNAPSPDPQPREVARLDASSVPEGAKALAPKPAKHKAGRFDISIHWRTRVEGWQWFEGNTGNSDYPLWHSLLRVGVGQTRDRIDWFVEGETASILGLPNDAVAPAPLGQLGLGGTYYAANGNHTNNTNGFLKQAFVDFKGLGRSNVKLGRFEFFDGLEIKPADPLLGAVIQGRIAHRLLSNFGFTAVQRTFDGGEYQWNSGPNNLTIFGARPTAGIFQVDGMDELDVAGYYGAYNRIVTTAHGPGALRVFAVGYVDDRNTVLKTDNRPQAVRAADLGKVEIATYGADYVQVLNTKSGKFDLLAWGVVQTGSWGSLKQRAGAFVTEAGWQPGVAFKPWISAGYSYGSGDGNPNDATHGTFFQVLTTPRQYARFPFYNMMNNADLYTTLNLHPASKLAMRTEAHAIRLASGSDLWYAGGGAFQPKTFGYLGRPSGGHEGLANVWDISADYKFTSMLSANVYYGHAWGKAVISSIYPRNANGQFVFVETDFHF
jgi:Alginate export